MKKLLNIDGGGVRVYFSLLILNYIEEKTNKNIVELFDYYAGVSASSIILAGLLTKYTVKDMLKIFKDISSKIFYRSIYQVITSGFGLFYSKYTDDNINIELKKLLENFKLNDCKKPLAVLTYDLNSSKPICFYSYQDISHDLSQDLWKVIRGSTAAPTYFQPYKLNDYSLIDGGVVTNNLSEMTFLDALNRYGDTEEYFQLSIGTGVYHKKFTETPSGLWSWSGSILDIFFNATSSYEMLSLNKLSKYENLKFFHRVDITLEQDIKLDDYNSFDLMDSIFDEWLENNKDYLDTICDQLVE
jgi:patatin-like phospholipase/acyl hydrolase